MMKVQPQAKIISYTLNCNEVCASAARISTTTGDANEIFEQAKGNPKNVDLIGKVLKSGHRSIIEHAVFNLAFWNISAFVEQYLIECRLASFTVKSRRYVDFGSYGYHIPPELEGDALGQYQHYMDLLFSAYRTLVDAGAPKEDARFVLPYSFHSNFYCTLNARELVHIISSIRYGRGRQIPELQILAGQLAAQAVELFPALQPELEQKPSPEEPVPSLPDAFRSASTPCFVPAGEAGGIKLLGAPSSPLDTLCTAYQLSASDPAQPFSVSRLLASDRPRELEQLTYSFLISDVTLSGITHLVRHRMQSIIIPPIQHADHSRYIAPASIRERPELWNIYFSALTAAHEILRKAAEDPQLRPYGYYFAVSGNMMDIMTTMNARELKLFLQLRTCSRAQWEVRGIAVSMLRQLRGHCPDLFDRFGPSCYLFGRCPEGKLTCGKMAEVCSRFQP